MGAFDTDEYMIFSNIFPYGSVFFNPNYCRLILLYHHSMYIFLQSFTVLS